MSYKTSLIEYKIVFISKIKFLEHAVYYKETFGSVAFSCIKYGSRPCSLSLIFSFENGGYNLVVQSTTYVICTKYSRIHTMYVNHCMFLAFLKILLRIIFSFCILRMYNAKCRRYSQDSELSCVEGLKFSFSCAVFFAHRNVCSISTEFVKPTTYFLISPLL